MAASLRRPAAPAAFSASRRRRPTCCGRWTSRAGSVSATATRCHPLTIVDDHSRYALVPGGLRRSAGPHRARAHLATTFRRYGLPEPSSSTTARPGAMPRASAGPGSASGCSSSASRCCTAGPIIRRAAARTSASTARSRPRCSPSNASAISPQVQRAFDRWREVYNFERPHEALGQDVPASRYRPSPRSMPDRLPQVRVRRRTRSCARVSTTKAYVSFKGRLWKVPQAFRGERLAIRPLDRRRPLRHLLRRPPDRHHRLDQNQNCRSCLRTGVGHVPGLNTKSEDDTGLVCSGSCCKRQVRVPTCASWPRRRPSTH